MTEISLKRPDANRMTVAFTDKQPTGMRDLLARQVIFALVVVLVLAISASLSIGPIRIPVLDVAQNYLLNLFNGAEETPAGINLRDWVVLSEIRLPRTLLGALVGSALAVSGAVMQGLFRNPLADPGIVGVSAGAGLGAASLIVLGGTTLAPIVSIFGIYALPLAAFGGGLCSTWLLYRIGTRGGVTSIATLLLAGIALGAFAGAITGLLVYVADDQQLRDLTFWGLGSLAGASWEKVFAAAPLICATLFLLPILANGLNALMLGEAAAGHMGVRVQRLKNISIIMVAAASGASVAVSGGIGFVGIIVPHLLRLTIGPDHRYLLPASALLGASFLIATDTISRTIVAPAELPIGILTAFVGAPFFLWLLLRKRGLSSF
ncbi:iron chelate uptake ABC transporter family permease subunit [Labrenzia sp. CE80]|uniref:FecCD family ABC transporter permease n=1 Tax=Labrenzia sp. CE80 TaxID=1788986 RepID=UPI00138A3A37|nr:iron chelate uptake ABC transporter family permease subunit [Labrenzia sp. CE80]